MQIGKKIVNTLVLSCMFCSCLTACGNASDNSGKSYVPPEELKGEITVSVYQSEEWLEMAAQMFEDKYPDVNINIEAFYTGIDTYTVEGGANMLNERPTGQTKEDYTTWLNTHLITGDAGDIIATSDGLAVGKYESMGVFEDLTPYLKSAKEINEEGYYMNIFDAYRTESGALYKFPVSAMASPLFIFHKEIVDETGLLSEAEGKNLTWREALTLAEEMYDNSELSGKGFPEAQAILSNIFTKEVIASVDYVSGQVSLREKELLDILNAFDEFAYFNPFYYGEGAFQVFELRYMEDVSEVNFVLSGYDVAVQWKQSDGKVHLSPYFTKDFGINSRSENKPLAWEFLKFLLSDEVQTLPVFPYAGINKNGLRARVEAYCKAWEIPEEEVETRVELIGGWLSQVNGYRPEDTDLIQVGDAIMAEFLNGNLTAEEAVNEVKFRLEQYLSE